MTAAVLYGSEDVRIERVPIPIAGPGEIVVRVHAALTCGTDLKVYRRGYHATHARPRLSPSGMNWQASSTKSDAGVNEFRAGDRVVALNSAPCDECYYCRRDQQNLCDDLLFNNGAYAEFILHSRAHRREEHSLVPAGSLPSNTPRSPSRWPASFAALKNRRPAGDTDRRHRSRPIGLMFMHVAQLAGLHVIAVVKRDEQVAAARTFGAEHVIQITSADRSRRRCSRSHPAAPWRRYCH